MYYVTLEVCKLRSFKEHIIFTDPDLPHLTAFVCQTHIKLCKKKSLFETKQNMLTEHEKLWEMEKKENIQTKSNLFLRC